MHSRIFQLEENIEKLENSLLTEDEIIYNHNWFLNSVADYVMDISEKDEDIEWFINSIKEKCNDFLEIDNKQKSITFLPGFKYRYFIKRFNYLKQQINEIKLDDFCEEWSISIELIKNAIEDKFGFYIFNEYYGLITLDSFIRSLPNDSQVTYYFGSILDYHF